MNIFKHAVLLLAVMSVSINVADGFDKVSFVSARASSVLESGEHYWSGKSWCTWGADFSIDGIIRTKYGKIFHGVNEDYPWLEVELSRPTRISSVTIHNRPDCCGDRLRNVEIRAGMTRVPFGKYDELLNINSVCGTYQGPARNAEEIRIVCASPVLAKFITIQLKDKSAILQINEVNALGPVQLPKDGNWNLLFRQTLNGEDELFKKNEWSRNKENIDAPNFSRLEDFESFRKPDGKFHLFLWYPELGGGNEWTQTSNPVTKTSRGVDNYTAISISYSGKYWGGLEYNYRPASLLDGSINQHYWWYAIGATKLEGGYIPGPSDNKVHQGIKKVELYIDYQEDLCNHSDGHLSASTQLGIGLSVAVILAASVIAVIWWRRRKESIRQSTTSQDILSFSTLAEQSLTNNEELVA